MEVLLLNASEEILDVIDWVRAVKLLFANKAEKAHNHDECYNIKTSSGIYILPSVIILRHYVHVPYVRSKSPSKRNIYRRDDNTCQYCGCHLNSKNASIDHVTPRSRGGIHTWNNVVAACKPCNRKKGSRTPEDVGLRLKKQPTIPSRRSMILADVLGTVGDRWSRWVDIMKS